MKEVTEPIELNSEFQTLGLAEENVRQPITVLLLEITPRVITLYAELDRLDSRP